MIDVCCSKEAGKLAKFRVWDKVLEGSAVFLEIYNFLYKTVRDKSREPLCQKTAQSVQLI